MNKEEKLRTEAKEKETQNITRWVYLDGKFVPKEEAKVSVYDHGLLYGDGVFEGIRCYNGRIFKLEEHVKRLYASAKAILLTIPVSLQKMQEIIIETVRKNQLHDGYIRVVVTRGVGDLGLSPWKCGKPFIFVIVDKIDLYPPECYEKGLSLITVPTRRHIPEGLNPNIKSLNYLNNILAKIEAHTRGAQEAIMLNSDGFVAECTGENIFLVKDKSLYTPPPYVGALDGITKRTVMELARSFGYPVKESIFTRFDVYNADECFLTGTAAELIPVTKVDERIIGDGVPGPITRLLMEKFRQLTATEGVAVYE